MPVTVGHIIEALSSLGGQAHLRQIVDRVSQIAPKPHPASVQASVRARIQERCREAESYKPGNPDLFESVHGIRERKGIWRLRHDNLNPADPDGMQDETELFIEADEGRATLRIHLRKERSRALINAFKASITSFVCSACGFDFEKTYGEVGIGYIEAHHTIPVADLDEKGRTKLTDLAPLCANCHRMVHRSGLISIDELKRRIDRRRALDSRRG